MSATDMTSVGWFLGEVRHHFGYLFDRYGFEEVHGENASTSGRHLIVIESSDCRFRFVFNRGDVEITIGTNSASLGWQDTSQSDIGIREWYPIQLIHDFINQKTVDLEAIRQQGRIMFTMSPEELLSYWARSLEPICSRVVQLFRRDVFETTQTEIEQYAQEQAQILMKQIDENQRSLLRSKPTE